MKTKISFLIFGLLAGVGLGSLATTLLVEAKINPVIAGYQARVAECADLRSAATALYETPSTPSVPLLDGMVSVGPGPALPGGPPVLRWIIPAKVVPTVAPDAHGAAYIWVDAKGVRQGPFTAKPAGDPQP
jgi:hypothetical protein